LTDSRRELKRLTPKKIKAVGLDPAAFVFSEGQVSEINQLISVVEVVLS